jgi:hypothetical protein
MKPLSCLGSLCLIACSLTALNLNAPALAQNSDYGDTPADLEQPADVSVDSFEDELAPHGRWIDTPEYGRVWIPNVEEDFQPYATNGRWVVTSYGNTWVSDYEWGWAAFHYGRWYRHDTYGWAWVPGRVWGPAWVSWRSGGGYYGWAPLSPSVSININLPGFFWTFVPQAYITSYRVYDHYVPRTQVVNVYQNTTIVRNNYRINNRTYVYGPRRQEIEQVTNRRVEVYQVNRSHRPGRSTIAGQQVSIYRPESTGHRRGENANRYGYDNSRRIDRQSPTTNGNNSEQPRERRRSYRQSPETTINPVTPPSGSEQPRERRRSYRQSPETTINPVTPNTNSEQPRERRRSYRQSPETTVNPVTPNTNSEQPRERRRSYRQSPETTINPITPNTNSEQPRERRRSYRQSPETTINPVTPRTGGEQPRENRRSYREPSTYNPVTPSRSVSQPSEYRRSRQEFPSSAPNEGRRQRRDR